MSQLIPPPETPQEHHDIPDPSKASPLSRFFFLETVFAILLSALLIVGGLMAASTMVKEGNPDINFAIATIQTNWGGADPETIENQVTDKIEKELKSLGLADDDLATQGRYLMTDNDIGDFPIGGGEEDLEIRLSTQWASRNGGIGGATRMDELLSLPLFTQEGKNIPGSQVFEIEEGEAPLSITHKDAQRTVTVLAKNKGRTVGEIVADLEPKLIEMKKEWGQGYDYNFAGELETQGETFASAGQMAIVSLFLIFAVLVIQFSSFTQPFIIMLAIPFAFNRRKV